MQDEHSRYQESQEGEAVRTCHFFRMIKPATDRWELMTCIGQKWCSSATAAVVPKRRN